MNRSWLGLTFVSALSCLAVEASAQAPLEDYASLPQYRSAELSPSGERLATIVATDGKEVLCVFELAKEGFDCYADATDMKAGRVMFAGEDAVVLVASQTRRTMGYRGKYEASAAFGVDLQSKKVRQIAARTDDLHPAQSGMGRIVAVADDSERVYLPGFIGSGNSSRFSLIRGEVDNSYGRETAKGSSNTIDWFAKPDGTPVAREDFNNKTNTHSILSYTSGSLEEIFEDETEIVRVSASAITSDYKKLVLFKTVEETGFDGIYFMDLDTGEIEGPVYHQEGKEASGLLVDKNRVAHGVVYSGTTPSYDMFDETLDQEIDALVESMAMISVHIDSWSDDWSKILLYMEGGELSGRYILYDRMAGTYTTVTDVRPGLNGKDNIGEVFSIRYNARDGLSIPAILTWPVGVPEDERNNLPMVVLPHGGPESFDMVGFDWMAQSFASQGYLVLQPNFRGSSGFGSKFTQAGRGEWGKAMQHDVTDGLDALVAMGWADPDRVCIVGWSYGGYAALAGGAFTPEKYKCVVSIAGVSDLPTMLNEERRDNGRDHWVYAYWTDQIGDVKANRDELEAISPRYHADKFTAPVLLIHGRSDLVVSDRQSRSMEDALEKAGKSVDLILMKDQDHSLSTKNSRVEAFTEVMAFVNQAIGKND